MTCAQIRLDIKICFILALLIISSCAAKEAASKQILILASYNPGLKWTDSLGDAIEDQLSIYYPDADFHFEYMDTKRQPPTTARQDDLKELYRNKYMGHRFDVVVCSDDDAFQFLLSKRDDLFPGSPVVFCGVNSYEDQMLAGRKGFTGVVEESDFPGTLSLMLNLHPGTRQIIIVNDQTTTGNGLKRFLGKVLPDFNKKVNFTIWDNMTVEELQRNASALQKGSLILLLNFNRDRDGKTLTHEEAAWTLRSASNVPVYCMNEVFMGFGVIGGIIPASRVQGNMAADLALRVLRGESVDNIPVTKKLPSSYIFDLKELRYFNVSTALLPSGSLFINQPFQQRSDFSNENLSGLNLSDYNMNMISLNNSTLFEANLIGVDLGDADLVNTCFDEADLEDADLSGSRCYNTRFVASRMVNCKLISTNLTNANLNMANLSGSNLIESDLDSSDLCKANLSDAHLRSASMHNARLIETKLMRSDLSKAHLDASNLSNSDLRDANLADASLIESNLTGSNLGGARFPGADLSSAILKNLVIKGANFFAVRMNWADLSGSSIIQGQFARSELFGTNLSNCDLTGLDITRAYLFNANLENSILSRAKLEHSDLSNANLRNATLHEVIFTDVYMDNANLSGADLSGSYLTGAILKNTVWKDANLRGSNISLMGYLNSDFRGADLRNSWLSGIYINGADFSGADLRNAVLNSITLINVDFSGADLQGIQYDMTTLKSLNESNLVGAKISSDLREDLNKLRSDSGHSSSIPSGE